MSSNNILIRLFHCKVKNMLYHFNHLVQIRKNSLKLKGTRQCWDSKDGWPNSGDEVKLRESCDDIKYYRSKLTFLSQGNCPLPMRKIQKYQLIFWCGNFVETISFRKASGNSSKTLPKLCVSTNFSHHEIR